MRGAAPATFVLAALMLAGCGGQAPDAASIRAGVVVLRLADGAPVSARALGEDPVAVAVSADGRTAYVSDNRPGIVRALRLPSLKVLWEARVGGRPGPILVTFDVLDVSLYAAGEVVELAPADGAVIARHRVGTGPGQLLVSGSRVLVACADGRAWDLDGHSIPGGAGFGIAAGPGGTWTSDYASGALVRLEDGRRVQLPAALHAFWLEEGTDGRLLAAAEGDDEDRDPGALVALGDDLVPAVLGRPRDPDQVAASGSRVFVAAHGERRVLVDSGPGRALSGFGPTGLEVVALALAPSAGLLVLAINAGE